MLFRSVQEVLNMSGLGPNPEPGIAGADFVDADAITMDREGK